MVEANPLELGTRENLVDGRVCDLGIEIRQSIAAVWIEANLLERVRARAIHLDDDGCVPRVGAQYPADQHGFGEVAIAQGQQFCLSLRKLVRQSFDLDAFVETDHQLCIGQALHFIDEGHLLFQQNSLSYPVLVEN